MRHVQAQEKHSCYAGVFVTQDDFIHNHLSHKINTGAEGYKLNFSFPADLTLTVKLVTPDTVYKFAPGSIFGYDDCGNIFRYYSGKELNVQEDFYKIEETGGIVLYSSQFVSGKEIFYSETLTSPIHRLTWRNLKDDFKDYPEFIEKVRELKKRPDGLATRDKSGFIILKIYRENIEAL